MTLATPSTHYSDPSTYRKSDITWTRNHINVQDFLMVHNHTSHSYCVNINLVYYLYLCINEVSHLIVFKKSLDTPFPAVHPFRVDESMLESLQYISIPKVTVQ